MSNPSDHAGPDAKEILHDIYLQRLGGIALLSPGGDDGAACCGVFGVVLLAVVVVAVVHSQRVKSSIPLLADLKHALAARFLVRACGRCREQRMLLIEVSPSGRSIEYQCLHCHKRARADAVSPDAPLAVHLLAEVKRFNPLARVEFTAPAPTMVYERSSREPIPEAIRNEVWRRDGGQCVMCSSRYQLEFDHIIPVSRGGSSSARNLQLLCRSCNQSKSSSI